MFRTASKIIPYAEIDNGKEVTKYKREKVRVEMTKKEKADTLVRWAANDAQAIIDETNRKRKKLIAHEKNKAIDAQIASQRVAINNMDDAALDNAIEVAGL